MTKQRTIRYPFLSNLPTICAFFLLIGVSLFIATQRLIGRDEGYYLYAARDVLSGRLPYIDFFYPQMPLLPYVYAAPFAIFGESWLVGRLTAALITISGGILIYLIAKSDFGSKGGMIGLSLYTFSSTIMVWNNTAETYSLSVALCLATVFAYRTLKKVALAGVFFGLCILTRLTFAPIGAIFLLELIYLNKEAKLLNVKNFALGCLLGITPALLFLALDGENFLFNNLFYHTTKSSLPEEYFQQQRVKVLLSLFGFREAAALNTFQFPFFLYTSIVYSLWLLIKRLKVEFNCLLGLALIVIHILPSPPYLQYFVVAIPFLILCTTRALLEIHNQIYRWTSRPVAITINLILSLIIAPPYLFSSTQKIMQYTLTGDDVIGVGDKNVESWKISTVSNVSKILDQYVAPGEELFASWPGYLIETQGKALRRTENHFGVQYAKRVPLTCQKRKKLRIKRPKKIIKNFEQGRYHTAILYTGINRSTPMRESLLAVGAKEKRIAPGITLIQRVNLEYRPKEKELKSIRSNS